MRELVHIKRNKGCKVCHNTTFKDSGLLGCDTVDGLVFLDVSNDFFALPSSTEVLKKNGIIEYEGTMFI